GVPTQNRACLAVPYVGCPTEARAATQPLGPGRSFVSVAFTLAIMPFRSSKTASAVHDVAVVRHNNQSVAPAPACATQQRITLLAFSSSRFPVGSSASPKSGSFARALAIATRCCSPPLKHAPV